MRSLWGMAVKCKQSQITAFITSTPTLLDPSKAKKLSVSLCCGLGQVGRD